MDRPNGKPLVFPGNVPILGQRQEALSVAHSNDGQMVVIAFGDAKFGIPVSKLGEFVGALIMHGCEAGAIQGRERAKFEAAAAAGMKVTP